MSRTALICGGSIGGLFAARALMTAGWQVTVLERSDVPLAGRGAGIVTHRTLHDALVTVDADLEGLGVTVSERVAYARSGARVRTTDYPQIVTSWDRIHRILRAGLPDDSYRLGAHVTGYSQRPDGADVHFADGRTQSADVVVGADGFRSAIRAQMHPDVTPAYAGYVVWRALAREADLPASVLSDAFRTFGFFLPTGSQIIGYPIAGVDNDLREGHRRYNFVWYLPVAPDDLRDMLTDDTGLRHAKSIPPPLVREETVAAMLGQARERLPAPFWDILQASERPFFTPIYDHHSPSMAEGHVALTGDAACVARPHVGMGVTKAAEDALALRHHLSGGDIAAGLAAYSTERVAAARIAYERARHLGALMLADGDDPDGIANPHIGDIMDLTAVLPDDTI